MPRKLIPVDELLLQDMIAGEVPLPKKDNQAELVAEETTLTNISEEKKEDIIGVKEIFKTSKKKKEQSYGDIYLAYNPINSKNRQQINIDGALYEKYSRFLNVVGNRKISVSTFVNNILQQHWDEHCSEIKQLYDNNVTKSLD